MLIQIIRPNIMHKTEEIEIYEITFSGEARFSTSLKDFSDADILTVCKGFIRGVYKKSGKPVPAEFEDVF